MEPNQTPERVRIGNPGHLPRLTAPEFMHRCRYSGQNDDVKVAVRRVVVDGGLVAHVAADMGLSRQNVHDSVIRFLDTTKWPLARMTEQEFAYAAQRRSSSEPMLRAARLYLVEGYRWIEACRVTGTSDIHVKDLVKRMRATVRRAYAACPDLDMAAVLAHDRATVYSAPSAGWQWPTSEELDAMEASCLVRRYSAMTYYRAKLVLVLKMAPSEATKLTNSSLQFVINSVDKVVAQLEQYRTHVQFPKSHTYLEGMHRAAAKNVREPLRSAVEFYLGTQHDLVSAAAMAGVPTETMASAVRSTVKEMDRSHRKQNNTSTYQYA